MSKITERISTTSTMTPDDRPIVAGSPRAKAQQAQRIKNRNAKAAKARPKRVTTTSAPTTTTTSAPKSRGFPNIKKIKTDAQLRAEELSRIK